jgi:peptidoglycan hydrolase-like protein with peptidoglycan-binding domain
MTFEWRDDESNGARIARCCEEALAPGPMGEHQRPEAYRAFVSCGLEPDGGKRLASIRTSCAIFARAVHHWCGRPARYPWRAGQGMFHGWLGDLDRRHVTWVDADAGAAPALGDLFYIERPGTNNNHVGFFVADRGQGVWRTAEGGGGDGTRCAFAVRILGPRFDHYGRTLQGWWRAARLDLTHAPSADPEVVIATPTLRRGDFGPAVRTMQAALGIRTDGIFGPWTEAALKAYQSAEGLVADGICGPRTWAAIRGEL